MSAFARREDARQVLLGRVVDAANNQCVPRCFYIYPPFHSMTGMVYQRADLSRSPLGQQTDIDEASYSTCAMPWQKLRVLGKLYCRDFCWATGMVCCAVHLGLS